MNDPQTPPPAGAGESADRWSALFVSMVMQQTNLILMLLGRVPHPESGQTRTDLEGAQFLIDQLEMLEVKTRGNLEPQEARLLQQNLMTLRLAFVEAVEHKPTAAPPPDPPPPSDPAPQPADPSPAGTAASEESHKRFSKKY